MNRVMQVVLTANNAQLSSVLAASSAQVNAFSKSAVAGNNAITASAASGATAMGAVAKGALGVGVAAAAALGVAVSRFADFDRAMSGVGAATMASASTMSALTVAALEAGSSTVFSATEAAGAITALAKAGVSTSDILGGALTGALDLAAAGELAVAEAAEIAATAMTQFGLAGSDVPHVADLLAAAAGKAQGEVTDMSAALNQSGLVASQMGLSIEETTATLGAFASAGLIGSDAGTSFRTMLLRLASPTQESSALMQSLGINVYDAQGQFIGMEGVAGNLRSSLQGLTQEQRNTALATIFGSDAIRAASILYEQGAGGVASWTGKVDDAGYAAEQAAIKTDNLAGDMERLGGAFDAALIKTGSGANDVLRFLTQSLTGAVDAFSALPGPVQAVTGGLLAVAAAVGLAGGGYGLLAPKIALANAALIASGPAGAKAAAGLSLAAKAAGALGVAFAGITVVDALVSKGLGTVVDDGTVASATLMGIAQSGEITRDSLVALGAETSSFGELMTQVFHRNVGDTLAAFIDQTDDAVDEATRFFESTDNGLASLVAAGQGADAARVFGVIADEAAKSGVSVDQISEALPKFFEAIEVAAAGANQALEEALVSGSAQDLANAIGLAQIAIEAGGLSAAEAAEKFPQLATAMELLALISPDTANQLAGVAISVTDVGVSAEGVDLRLEAIAAAMDRLGDSANDAAQSQADFTLALFGLADGMDLVEKGLTATGLAYDLNTEAGARNYTAVNALATTAEETALSLYEAGAAAGNSAAGYNSMVASLLQSRASMAATLIEMGYLPEAAFAIVDAVLQIPTSAEVDVGLNDGVTPAVPGMVSEVAGLLAAAGFMLPVGASVDFTPAEVQAMVDDVMGSNNIEAALGLTVDETAALQQIAAITGLPYEVLLRVLLTGVPEAQGAVDAVAGGKGGNGYRANIFTDADTGQAQAKIYATASYGWNALITANANSGPAAKTIAATAYAPWAAVVTAYGNTKPASSAIAGTAYAAWNSTINTYAATKSAEDSINYAARDRESTIRVYETKVRAWGGVSSFAEGGALAASMSHYASGGELARRSEYAPDGADLINWAERGTGGETHIFIPHANDARRDSAKGFTRMAAEALSMTPADLGWGMQQAASGARRGDSRLASVARYAGDSARDGTLLVDVRRLVDRVSALADRPLEANLNVDLDGRTIARAVHRVDAQNKAR